SLIIMKGMDRVAEPDTPALDASNHPDWMRSPRANLAAWILLAVIFAVGLAVRLYDLNAPPVDFHPTRQLHSALIARGMYYEHNPAVPAWQRQMAVNQWQTEGVIEPQVFERLVAGTYSLLGRVDLRAPRLYAILLWMVGAVFLAWLAFDLTGWGGALVASLFFLIWPYGVTASRAFLPEPLMIALMVAALWAALRWQRRGGWGWALAAGLLAGLSIYIKAVALFFLLPALAVLILTRSPLRRALRDPQLWALGGLALIPYAAYTVDGLYLHGYLVGQLSLRFFPDLWLDPAFYLRWISNLSRVLPFEMLLAALAGTFLVRRPAWRWALLAMWAGYFAYGMALSHHISTHDYYHLPLLPVIALGLGAVAQAVFQSFRGPAWINRLAAAAIILAALVVNGYAARTAIKRSGAEAQSKVWETVGQVIKPGSSVVALVQDYGGGLRYYAWVNPIIWPTSSDIQFRQSVGQDETFNQLFQSHAAGRDYFVVSPLDELTSQPQLQQVLDAHYAVLRQGPGYRIYDLRVSKPSP
ncbi:MAG TPA: glycosyltransferase family 39 protein, partial [Anaerolineaceae bacterium]